MSQRSLFLAKPSTSARVAGFSYWPEAFTAAEESNWLREIESLPFKPFEFHGYLGKRRIVSFTWHYDYSGRALRPSHRCRFSSSLCAPERRPFPASTPHFYSRRWSPNMTRA